MQSMLFTDKLLKSLSLHSDYCEHCPVKVVLPFTDCLWEIEFTSFFPLLQTSDAESKLEGCLQKQLPEDAGSGTQVSVNVIVLLQVILSQGDGVLLRLHFCQQRSCQKDGAWFFRSLGLLFLIILVRVQDAQDFGRWGLGIAVTEILLSVMIVYLLGFS